ncbi:hypothetical protein UPYG_G00239980 [Umbra pygmaea]|uniref:Insulin receptor substrate 1 n=1 Tax=Umbra pygmaea TaxID=75934 RepID=A0ABD0WF50_UMBPY
MESQPSEPQSYEDVRRSGYLRKQKSMHRRYFVLRTASERGPARLEYYESEKKFRGKAPVPKKSLVLETCFNINKRADAKNKHMIVLYTRAESFAIAAENEADQDEWFQAMVELQCKSKTPATETAGGDYGVPTPGPAFKEVWQVKVWPKGLGQAKNLVGIYRLCLTDKTVNFVKLNSDAAAVVLQLMNVRRCGHSENFFFVEVGRSAVTGPGEFWMQVDDSVVAQNMHETLLEAMKALSEEFRQRSKSQSNSGPGGGATASNPISVPSRRHHPNPPPSQVGFTRRPRTEPPGGVGTGGNSANASPATHHSFPRSGPASDGGRGDEVACGGAGQSSSLTPNGSCSNTPILRSKSARSAPTQAKNNPLGLMRSVSTPAPSPAPSLSSSSGHGSEFGAVMGGTGGVSSGAGVYSRVPSHNASVSGSPSDYGSSDEYGSSPGEHSSHSLLAPSPNITVGSSGLGGLDSHDEAANYILMGQRGGGAGRDGRSTTAGSLPAEAPSSAPSQQPLTRRVLRRSSSRECEAERRLMSKRASLPPMALERLAPRPRRGEEEPDEDAAEYAIMSRSTSRESFTTTSSSSSSRRDSEMSPGGGGGGYLEVAGELGGGGVGGVMRDNGYMSMLPGGVTQPPVTLSHSLSLSVADSESKPADDYMAMTPNNSVSSPQQIQAPAGDGYMMMSPNSSCSPDQRGGGGLGGGTWAGSSSADSRAGSDYMNMSPISARSVCSSPPPSEHPPQPDPHPHQHTPKMVYSYYSLPRSYKHMPSVGHFEDGPGRGRRTNGSADIKGVGRGVGGRQDPNLGAVQGRHLSLSSSSYSSSSASSESLGENEERAPQGAGPSSGGAQSKDSGLLQQRRACPKQGQQGGHRTRPVSLFVDVSKANTLPRVRENPLPPEPKSPGEYVSIEFKEDKSSKGSGGGRGFRQSYSQCPSHRPTSCMGGFQPLSSSPSTPLTPLTTPSSSEYVNMDLGPSPSPSPLSLTPLGFPSFPTPPTPPPKALAPKARNEGNVEQLQQGCLEGADAEPVINGQPDPVATRRESPPSCGDYTEMAFSRNKNAAPSSTSNSTSPKDPSPARSDLPVPILNLGLDFPLNRTGPNPDHGAKVIRADPQGRRRHCSETFLPSPSLPSSSSSSSASSNSASAASLFPEQAQAMARRLGFEGMLWGNAASVEHLPSQFLHPGPGLPATQALSMEQGLNYIDLDLANKESPHSALDGSSNTQAVLPRLFATVNGGAGPAVSGAGVGTGGGSNLNTYASIDFYKSEELRTHQNGNKDGTEC